MHQELEIIKLQNHSDEYIFTNDQIELLKELELFFKDDSKNLFILKGYAGTGKTYMIKLLVAHFKYIGRECVLAAPTGKAARVISQKTGYLASTIHKLIYNIKEIKEYKQDYLNNSETYKFYANLAVNQNPANTVFIVDEASMISDHYSEEEFIRFGSGYVLTDFFKFVNLDHNDHNKKVIFIGDNAQLPPVHMDFSPALNTQYLIKKFNVKPMGYELQEIVRQKNNSGIVYNTLKIREHLEKNIFNQLKIDLNHSDIIKIDHENLLEKYLKSCDRKINGESIIVAYSNADVADYNTSIREYFFPNQLKIANGDKVMAIKNTYINGNYISNGDFGLVKEVLSDTEMRSITLKRKNDKTNIIEEVTIELNFKDAIVGFKNLDNKSIYSQYKILENILYSHKPQLSPDENKALYVDFCIRHPQLKPQTKEFKDTLLSDKYFNALRLKFGYAITCHKAQGSEWNNVFINCKTHQNILSENYFRWLYTAMTRAKNTLYLLEPPQIGLTSNMKFSENILLPTQNNTISISEPPPEDTDLYPNTFGIPENSNFLLEILKNVKRLISGKKIIINSIIHNQYQESYYFEKEGEIVRINIAYNLKQIISKITAPKVSTLSNEIVDILSSLINKPINITGSSIKQNFEFDEDFKKDFYNSIMSSCQSSNIEIVNIKSINNAERYSFKRNTEILTCDFFYNAKKQFTNVMPVYPSLNSDSLFIEIQTLMTRDKSL